MGGRPLHITPRVRRSEDCGSGDICSVNGYSALSKPPGFCDFLARDYVQSGVHLGERLTLVTEDTYLKLRIVVFSYA